MSLKISNKMPKLIKILPLLQMKGKKMKVVVLPVSFRMVIQMLIMMTVVSRGFELGHLSNMDLSSFNHLKTLTG